MAFEVEFYETEDGSVPMADFLSSLSPGLRAKAVSDIEVLGVLGPSLREPHTKSVGGGLFELRTKRGSDIARSFFFFYVGRRIIMTNGFLKKSNKTPPRELRRAAAYRDDWTRRFGR